ncbi:hypothetical protein [Kangiella geojedonensis]|uniref:Uncharacterized protein n=1 Tax=Kangiella geojedonensis TaxID=914150 RepID=A0A0F6RCU1_9GAMM|nr:hypothetical protein [Kangiella geojedonensis]AKE52728.1 hypothetical protein TQ33_1788 [Kangiella geojedonensis]
MKKVIANIFTSSVFSSLLGSLVVFIGMVISLMSSGSELIGNAVGGALLFYFITAIVSCLIAIFVAGPVYAALAKYKMANYYTAFSLGLLVTLVFFGFSTTLESLYWNLAGGVTGLLFHYHYINIPSWVSTRE